MAADDIADPPAGDEAWTGRLLDDRYAVESVLGRGGMGTVYRAFDQRMRRAVVVKTPHARFLSEPGFRERFEREIRALTDLDHLHVVKALDCGAVRGVPYAVLQYLGGGNLKDRLASAGGRFAPSEIATWLPDAAAALDYIHERGVVHRDVKPANILFDERGNVFLSDFGIAKALGAPDTGLTQTGATPGSPDYMAPEVVTQKNVTPRYDQYALAVVLYEALTGRRPHRTDGESPMRVLYLKASSPPTPIRTVAPTIGSRVAEVVMRALEPDPARRFPSCVALAAEFARALEAAEPAAATSPDERTSVPSRPHPAASRSRRSPPPVKQKGVRRRLGLLVTAVSVGVGAWALLHRSGGPRTDPPRDSPPLPEVAAAAEDVPAAEVAWSLPQDGDRVAAARVRVVGRWVRSRPGDVAVVNGVTLDVAGDGLSGWVPLPADGPHTLQLDVRSGGVSRLRAPLRREVVRAAPWSGELTQAHAAAAAGRWADAAVHLAAARTRQAPDAEVQTELREGVARYEAPPVLVWDEPADGADAVTRTTAVRGELRSGRATDEVWVNGAVVRRGPGRFEMDVPVPSTGELALELRVVDGEVDRLEPRPRRTVRSALPWNTAVATATAAAASDDWEAVRAALEDARRLGATDTDMPAALHAGLAAYDAPPTVRVLSPLEGTILSSRIVRVEGEFSGRKTDSVMVGGIVVPVDRGRFLHYRRFSEWGAATVEITVARGPSAEPPHRITVELKDPGPLVGKPLPNFHLKGTAGGAWSNADLRGHWTVIEFARGKCPIAERRYESGVVPRLQATYRARGVAWFVVAACTPQESSIYFDDDAWAAYLQASGAAPTAVLRDADCEFARACEATRTLEFRIVDPQGIVVYEGGLGERDTAASVETLSETFIARVLDAVLAGRPAPVTSTKAYG